jgi:hypothetical protein
MANKRDVELLLRATDLSSKPLTEVADAVRKLSQRLNEQETAATKGEATLRELSTTLNQLNEASKALAGQNAAIERYRDLATQLETAKGKAEAASAAFASLKATTEGNEKATAAQTRELNKAETAANRSVADVQKRTAALEKQAAVLAQAGIDIQNLAAAEAQLVASATETGQSRARAATAIEQYDARLRQHRTEVKAAADAEKAAAAAIREAADAEEELTRRSQASRDQARAKADAQDAAAAGRARQWAQDYERFWVAALNDVEAKRKEEAEVAAFQEKLKAARAKEAASDYERFWINALNDVETKQAQTNKRLAEQAAAFRANREAIQSAFRATIGYTEAQETLARKQSGYSGKPGFLGLRPYELQNLSFQINDIITQLGSGASLTQALAQQGGQIFQLFQARLTGLVAVLPQLAVVVAVLGTTVAAMVRVQNTIQSTKEFTAQLALSADGLRYSATEIVNTQRALQKLGVDFDEAGDALRKFIAVGVGQTQLQDFVVTAQKLAKITQTDLKVSVEDLATAFSGNLDALEKLDQKYNVFSLAQAKAIREAYEEKGVIEARSMAYSILQARVDEAEKKLSGPLTRAFKAAKVAWLEFLDVIGNSSIGRALFATLTLGAEGLEKAANLLTSAVKLVAGEGGIAGQIETERKELEKLNAQREQMVNRNDRQAPDPAALSRVDEAIAARTLNIEFLNRAKIQAELTAQTEKGAKATREQAEATEAQRKAGERFLQDQQDQIDAAKGVNNEQRLKIAGQKAYDAALAARADPESANLARQRATAEEQRKITEELRSLSEGLAQDLERVDGQGDKSFNSQLLSRLRGIEDSYKAAVRRLDEFTRKGGTSIDGQSVEQYRARLDAERETARRKAFTAAQAKTAGDLEGKGDALANQLQRLLARGEGAQRENLQARLSAIDATFASAENKLRRLEQAGGGTVGGSSTSDLLARLSTQKELLKQNETIKFFEENINDLVKARQTIFKDVNDAVAAGAKTSAAGYAEARAAADELNPKIKQLAQDALTFARAFAEVRPGPQIMSFIAQMERQVRQAGDGPRSAVGTESEAIAKAQLDQINQKLATRRELEQAWQNLADKGVVSQGEASRAIQASYEEMNAGLIELTDNLEEFLEVAGDSLPAGKLELFRAKLAEVRSDMRSLDPATRRLVNTIEQAFTGNAVEAIDAVAESIGGAIARTKSWGDAFREIGAASLKFFADLLRDVAKAILQAQILAAIRAVTGAVFHEGGVVGSGGARRTMAAGPWFGAPRYHSGRAGVGMASDEVAAVLQRGEEVLSRDDPRNVLNAGRGRGSAPAGGGGNVRQVLVLDQAQIPAAMQSSSGERVVLTHIKANAPAIRNILGV